MMFHLPCQKSSSVTGLRYHLSVVQYSLIDLLVLRNHDNSIPGKDNYPKYVVCIGFEIMYTNTKRMNIF